MTRDVLISICGNQYTENGTAEPIEIITKGSYSFRNNKHYVVYEEVMDGTTEATKNVLKFCEKEASLKRTGISNVQMLFNNGGKSNSNYSTPFGNLMIGIDTTSIDCRESQEEITLEIKYGLEMNFEFLANCTLNVKIVPMEKGLSL